MSNIEKIRQEIDKWIYNTDEWEVSPGEYNKSESEVYKVGWRCGLGHIREFIDSLPEDEPSKMSDQEIDKWVEEHVVVPDDVSEEKKPLYDDIVPAITQWGKIVAKKFYKLGKEDERKVNMLTGPLW